jgi:heme-degrading monooxygenase HmoA
MITRIVKMTFKPGTEDDFKEVFRQSAPVIKTFDGCNAVNAFGDVANPHIYFTISQWDSEDALNNYRNSPFFKQTWTKTKALFAAKAEAWSILNLD